MPIATETPHDIPQREGIRPITLLSLALLAAVAPFAIDLYLPAFPRMVDDLGTTSHGVQLSLTAFLAGSGLGQAIFGPWSDRAGRRTPLLTGLGIYLIASLVALFAQSIEVLIAARLVQGIGGSAGMVIGRAIVLDSSRGGEAARGLNIMMMVGGIAPVVAPLTGSMLADVVGWRGLLGIVTVVGIIALIATLTFVNETRPAIVRQLDPTPPFSLRPLLRQRYIGFAMAFAFGMSILLGYISASPFVYQTLIGLSTPVYGAVFAVNALGLVSATALSTRLGRSVPVTRLIIIGLSISGTAILAILALTLLHVPTVWIMGPMFFTIAPLGLVFGNATATALSSIPPSVVGSGSALIGVLQFTLAGASTALVGLGGSHSVLPMALTLTGAVTLSLTGWVIGSRAPAIRQRATLA